MKKYLILLAMLSIPITTYAYNELSRSNEAVPTINTATIENGNVFLNWDTPINEESIFFSDGYENISLDLSQNINIGAIMKYNGHYLDSYGNPHPSDSPIVNSLKVLDGYGYTGKGVIAQDTANNNGWDYTYYDYLPKPNGVSYWSSFIHSEWKQLKVDKKAIVRVKAKGDGYVYADVRSGWTGASVKDTITWAENLTAEELVQRLSSFGKIKVNNPTNFTKSRYHLATALDSNYSYNFLLAVGEFIKEDNQWYFKSNEWYGAWVDDVKPEQTVTPNNQRTVEDIYVGKPLYYLTSGGTGSNTVKINSEEWTNYSFNINIPNSQVILDTNRYFRITNGFRADSILQVDDLTIAYAPKSRVYRNGELIMSDDYTVEFTDTTATDKASPNSPIVKMNRVSDGVELAWEEATDNGTTYRYQVTSVSENNEESAKSVAKDVEIKSGVKHYEVYSNNTLLTTTTNTYFKLNNNIDITTVKVVAVDNAGNKSPLENLNIPTLTATPNPSENFINLKWSLKNDNYYTYQLYQQKPNSTEFNSISMTNISDEKKVKVLNIYPTAKSGENIPLKTDGSTDLAGKTESNSALLNDWIKEYGLGKIDVASINQEDFEANPNKYLKDSSGNYLYDVVVVGFWNINYREAHINDTGMEALTEFVDSGRGILTGHHHMGLWQLDQGMNKLKDRFGVKFVVESGWTSTEQTPITYDYIAPEKSIDRWRSNYWHGSDKVIAKKQGMLLNYPWNISQEGRIFNIPYSHNANEFVTGDVWLEYYDATAHNMSSGTPAKDLTTLPDGTTGSKSAYLSTYNNTALIQTGHSSLNGTLYATEDEKKILANTIFYLNQLSTDKFLNDRSGQDVNAPNKPNIYEYNFLSSGEVEIKFNEVTDNGSKYKYYLKATGKDNSSVVSNIIETEIKSGLKGYSYVIDSNAETIPDDIVETTTAKTIKVKNSSSNLYVHIKAIDNVGNSSETLHYKISDVTKPTLELSINPNSWTNGSVTINAKATDSESGIKSIVLPNGNIVNATTASYTVNANGIYYFKAIDNIGNETISSITISNIDKNNPMVTIQNNTNWTNQNVPVTIIGTDY